MVTLGSGDPDEEWLDQNEQVQQQQASYVDMDSGDDEPVEGGAGRCDGSS